VPQTEKTAVSAPASTPAATDVAAPAAAAPTEVATPAAPTPPAAAEPVEEPKPTIATHLSPVDIPIAEKLRDLVNTKLTRFFDRKPERSAVETFYRGRQFAPLWIENGAANARAKDAIAHLRGADADGLDPTDYPTPEFKAGADPEALATAELKLLGSALTYARHAQTGRVHYSRVAADIFYNLATPEPAEILADLALAENAGKTLGDYNPPHAQYKALRAKLAEIRNGAGESGPVRIPGGGTLKVGMEDPRVPQLRARFGLPAGENNEYDKSLSDAVKAFQKQKGISPTGTVGPATIDALNGPRRDRDADVIVANMERWRWLPRDLGKTHVILNIPHYTLKVFNGGAVVWQTKVVVGKPDTATPLLSETMKYITVNPTWNVPPSIVYNEYLPVLQQDPGALARIGVKVTQNRDGSLHMYQPPGDGNALGRIRFNFPNKFLVYQHDTPDKHLFGHDRRAYSHGCMRVQDPFKYAEVLLSLTQPQEGYTQDRLKRMVGANEIDIRLATHIPVHLTYQTAFVDEAGKLVIREDIYGRDARVLNALRGDERRLADVPIDRRETPVARPRVAPGTFAFSDGPSFFERLFGGYSAPPPEPPAPVRRRSYTR
jgi:murein L,D-transpeptidase YcbB/YkuD